MSITPPERSDWWNEPVERTEALWVGIALLWAIIMFFMMPYWHMTGQQNMSNEAYRITPDAYSAKVDAFIEKYKVGEEGNYAIAVVEPEPGSDVYLEASSFMWRPIIRLQKGKSYRIHMSSLDVMHGFSLQPTNINLQVHPNYEMVLTVTPTTSGEFGIVCNEYCGGGHHIMLGKMYVTE